MVPASTRSAASAVSVPWASATTTSCWSAKVRPPRPPFRVTSGCRDPSPLLTAALIDSRPLPRHRRVYQRGHPVPTQCQLHQYPRKLPLRVLARVQALPQRCLRGSVHLPPQNGGRAIFGVKRGGGSCWSLMLFRPRAPHLSPPQTVMSAWRSPAPAAMGSASTPRAATTASVIMASRPLQT